MNATPWWKCSTPNLPSSRSAAFVELLNRHRQPCRAIEAGDEGPVDVPFILGNYLYGWAWLSLFSPRPVYRTDWATMRDLMTG